LNIYCVSLSERNMGESDLASLFNMLPNRCVVLLEDIDSAGIQRDKGSVDGFSALGTDSVAGSGSGSAAVTQAETKDQLEENPDKVSNQSDSKKSFRRKLTHSLRTRKAKKTDSETTTLVSTTDEMAASPTLSLTQQHAPSIKTKPPPPSPTPEPAGEEAKSKISLAGLLNIIDGAASNEGRVLIMTTNYPEKLDPALIRPGRVDLQIRFTLATRDQMQEIFRRMYSNDADVATKTKNGIKTPTSVVNNKKKKKKKMMMSKSMTAMQQQQQQASSEPIIVPCKPNFATLHPNRLGDMARLFAESLPEHTFSPAEVQGYLLMRKTDPEGALSGVREWKEALLEAKRRGKKVVEVK